jgi:mRNA-degrading endonuclease RelE of RelBE toxin-antitoxin system
MIDISTQAQIAIYSLQPQDQKRVKARIEQLESFPANAQVIQANRVSGPGFDDLYLVRVTPKLRLVFRYTGDRREIVDVINHDQLARMSRYVH